MDINENWSDKEYVQSKLMEDPANIQYVSPQLCDDEEIVRYIVKDAETFKYASQRIRGSKRFIRSLEDWNHSQYSIRHLSEELRDDEEIILTSFRWFNKDNDEFQYISERLKKSKNFMLDLLPLSDEKKLVYEYALEHFGDDEDIIYQMVSNKEILNLIPNEMRNKKRIVLASVEAFPMSLKDVPTQFQDDEEIVEVATRRSQGEAFQFASERLRKDKNFIIKFIEDVPAIMEYVPSDLRKDEEAMFKLSSEVPWAIRYVDESLSKNPNFIKRLINRKTGKYTALLSLYSLPFEIRDNEDLMLLYFETSKCINDFHYVSRRLKSDKNFILKLAKININVLSSVDEGILLDKKFMLKLISINPDAVEYLPRQFANNEEFVKTANQFKQNFTKASEVAASWWADCLGTLKQNNGNEITSLILGLISVKSTPENNAKEKFYEALKNRLITSFESGSQSVTLSTDYGPEGILAEVASICKINGYAFPCKTCMWISAKEVSVSAGYQAKAKVIYTASKISVEDNKLDDLIV